MAHPARQKQINWLAGFTLFAMGVWGCARAEGANNSMSWNALNSWSGETGAASLKPGMTGPDSVPGFNHSDNHNPGKGLTLFDRKAFPLYDEESLLSVIVDLNWLRGIGTASVISVPEHPGNGQDRKNTTPPEKMNGSNTPPAFSCSESGTGNQMPDEEGSGDGNDGEHFIQVDTTTVANWNQVLLNAAARGNLELVMDALQHGADINTTNEQGQTPLRLAVINGHTPVAVLLVDWGADLAALEEGYNELDYSLAGLLQAQHDQNTGQIAHLTTVIHHMLSAGGQLAGVDFFGWFAVHDVAVVEQALQQLGGQAFELHQVSLPLINSAGHQIEELWAFNPVHVAVFAGTPEVTECLCLYNPQWVNEQAVCIETGIRVFAINLAASGERTDIVRVLLMHGAGLGRAHQVFLQQTQLRPGLTLQGASNLFCMSPVVYIFTSSDDQELQQLALHQTVRRSQLTLMEIIHYLSDSGNNNEQALLAAASRLDLYTVIREQNCQAANILLRLGYRGCKLNSLPGIIQNPRTLESPTPLNLACSIGSVPIVRWLLNHEANIGCAEHHALAFMRGCCGGLRNQPALYEKGLSSPRYANSESHSVLAFVFFLTDDPELQVQVFTGLRMCNEGFTLFHNIFYLFTMSDSSDRLVNLVRNLGCNCLQYASEDFWELVPAYVLIDFIRKCDRDQLLSIPQSVRDLMPTHIQELIPGFNGMHTLSGLAAMLFLDAGFAQSQRERLERAGLRNFLNLLRRLGLISPEK